MFHEQHLTHSNDSITFKVKEFGLVSPQNTSTKLQLNCTSIIAIEAFTIVLISHYMNTEQKKLHSCTKN